MTISYSHHSLGHTLYTLGAILLLFVVTIFSPVNSLFSKAVGVSELYNLTNVARKQYNQKELSINSALMNAAQTKAEHMAKNQYFEHFAPDGTSPWSFIKNADYSYEVAGENLAITNQTDQDVVQGWLDSPTHRENLLSNEYTEIGIGIAKFGDYKSHKETTVVVAFYAKPKSAAQVNGKEETRPAGTISTVSDNFYDNFNPMLIGSVAISLILAGAMLEVKHIRQKHHIP